ncbi:MAG: hypothetical protein LUO93_03760 [Methanomicrobiales archaeon]|nr:hypothetical protein [Methanomicrobiales archaeon]
MRRLNISMSSKKPITLRYVPETGEPVLLAKETTTFRGEVEVKENLRMLQWIFEGENIENRKNFIRLDISY